MKKVLLLVAVCGLIGASAPAHADKGGAWVNGNCNMNAVGNKWFFQMIPLILGC